MDDTNNPKVSFIPKGSLVREESFLERPRPRSAIGFLAGLVFVSSIGSYIGLYFYEISLAKEVGTKTNEIKHAQKIFSDAPQVRTARLFRSRADLARELLSAHTIISPVLAFLSKNTLETVLYDRFSFLKGTSGQTLQLSGEALNYAALAYQADVLRLNTKELSKFSIQNIALTNFGTVTFTLDLVFLPGYLSYEKTSSSFGTKPQETTSSSFGTKPQETTSSVPALTTGSFVPRATSIIVPISSIATSTKLSMLSNNAGTVVAAATSSATSTSLSGSLGTSTAVVTAVTSTPSPVVESASSQKKPQQQLSSMSFIESVWARVNLLWSRFKFW